MKEPSPPPEPSRRQSKSALLEAAQAAIADQRAKAEEYSRPVRKPGRSILRTMLVLLIVTGTLLIVLRPTWLAGPSLAAEPAEMHTASAVLVLAHHLDRVRAFQTSHGRLPRTLAEAGITDQTDYRVTGSSDFSLTIATPDSSITVKSTDDLHPAVVAALRTLQLRVHHRGRP